MLIGLLIYLAVCIFIVYPLILYFEKTFVGHVMLSSAAGLLFITLCPVVNIMFVIYGIGLLIKKYDIELF